MDQELNTLRLQKIIVTSTVILLVVGLTLVFFGESIFPSTPNLDERIDTMREMIKTRTTGLQHDADEIEQMIGGES